jgi:hypothetical protein
MIQNEAVPLESWSCSIIRLVLFVLVLAVIGRAQTAGNSDGKLIVTACGSNNPPGWCAGSDIGAWTNSAASYLTSLGYSGGELSIEPTSVCYQFSTPIVLMRPFNIRGQGPDATCLQYVSQSGTAVSYSTGDRVAAGYGLHDLQLAGPGGGTSTGILLNGSGVVVENVVIGGKVNGAQAGFHVGMLFGSNAYLSRFSHSLVQHNDQNVYFPGAATPLNSGENVVFDHVTFSNGGLFTNCVQVGDLGYDGPQVTFISSSFDNCQLVNKNSMVTLIGGHLELVSHQSNPYVLTVDDNYLGFSGPHSTTMVGAQIFDNPPNAIISGRSLLEVDRYGSLNIFGLSDRASMLLPLVYLDVAAGGTPRFSIFAPDNERTTSELYSVAPGTFPIIMNLSNGQFDAQNGYKANGQTVIPASANGYHGTQGAKVQMSDGTGPSGNFSKFAADGSLTDSGYAPSAFPLKTGTEVAGHVACWKSTGVIGHCASAVGGDGACVCK